MRGARWTGWGVLGFTDGYRFAHHLTLLEPTEVVSRDPYVLRVNGEFSFLTLSTIADISRVSQHLAIHLAPAYNMKPLVVALARAVPDPNVSYRKSQRSQAAAAELAAKNTSTATPTTTRTAPSMTAPEAVAPTPKRRRAAETQSTDEQRRVTLEATTTVTAPAGAAIDVNAEIESAKQLVRDLKRELQLRAAAGDEFEETGGADVAESSSRGKKRAAEDEGTAISGGAGKTEERIIRTNRRVEQTTGGAAKRVAFGAMLFGLGASAALFLPQLAAQYL